MQWWDFGDGMLGIRLPNHLVYSQWNVGPKKPLWDLIAQYWQAGINNPPTIKHTIYLLQITINFLSAHITLKWTVVPVRLMGSEISFSKLPWVSTLPSDPLAKGPCNRRAPTLCIPGVSLAEAAGMKILPSLPLLSCTERRMEKDDQKSSLLSYWTHLRTNDSTVDNYSDNR